MPRRVVRAGLSAEPLFVSVLVDTAQPPAGVPYPTQALRRAIVSVTFASPEASTVHPREVAAAVQQAGVAFWPVAVRGAENPSAFQAGANALDNALAPTREVLFAGLPDVTGGLRLTAVSPAALELMLGRVAAALVSQYAVDYWRPEGPPVKEIRAGAT